MQNEDFFWDYEEDITFSGKDANGLCSIAIQGRENDNYDFCIYYFKDYEKLKRFISGYFGESFYEFLCTEYDRQMKAGD